MELKQHVKSTNSRNGAEATCEERICAFVHRPNNDNDLP